MKRVFGILALMVIASIMIAGCVQPTGNETVTPGTTTPGVTETPMGTVTTAETGTPMGTVTTAETGTTPTTPAANATETPPGPPAAAVAGELVSITESGFVPSSITVPSGTTVGWTNDAATNQTVTGTGNMSFFDSGLLQPGESFTYTFTATGNYTYTSQTTGAGGEVIVTVNTTA